MDQPKSVPNESPTFFHGHDKITQEENPEENQVHQDSGYTPNRRGTLETRSNHVFIDIIDPKQWIATNLTDRLPVTSSRGNKYLFSLYEYNRNSILVLPIKKKMNKDFIHVFQNVHEHLTIRGLNPNYMQLDNEASPIFQSLLKKKNTD